MEGIFVQWEVIIGLGIPAIGGIAFLVRYFIRKEKCFHEHKEAIKYLRKTNQEMRQDMEVLTKNMMLLMGKFDIKPID